METIAKQGCISYLKSWKESLEDKIGQGDSKEPLYKEQILFLNKAIEELEGNEAEREIENITYPESIMKALRKREGLDEDDTSLDSELSQLSKNRAFKEVLSWHGFIGRWDADIKQWIKDIYGIDLNEL